MDRETAAIIQNARGVSAWAAGAIVEVDALIAVSQTRPLSPAEQGRELGVLREMLVRTTQQHTLLEWAVEVREAAWWQRPFLRMLGRRIRP